MNLQKIIRSMNLQKIIRSINLQKIIRSINLQKIIRSINLQIMRTGFQLIQRIAYSFLLLFLNLFLKQNEDVIFPC